MPFPPRRSVATAIMLSVTLASAAVAETPRETLTRAAFSTHDKAQAIALVDQAITDSRTLLAHDPNDREARLQLALGVGYRGQLKRSPSDAKATLQALTAFNTAYPRDPEGQVALAGWHLTAIGDLGGFLAGTLLGAKKAAGYAALDRAVALGGNRAFFAGYAALIRVKIDQSDTKTALALAQRAVAAATPTPLDRVMQRAATRIIPLLQAGDGDGAARLAKTLLPFGTLS